ncbi:MAG: L-type lectin-domain containing protein [Bryobacteraceae bacterium]
MKKLAASCFVMGGVACALALCAAQAQAATLFTYNGFSNTSGLTLIGNTTTASTIDGAVLRLTTAGTGESGAAYSTLPVTLGANNTFSTMFQFRFTNPGGIDPADGITFLLAANPSGLGTSGVGLGYAGVPNSVAIEFDTYNNGAGDGNSSNHVGIDTGGNLTDSSLTNVYGNPSCGFANGIPAQNPNTAAGCLSNGHLWTANISYNGSNLTVTLLDPAEMSSFTAINGAAINLASILGTNTAFVGFTAGTGAGFENHDIVNWQFANTAQITGVPEPATPLLLGTGLLALAWLAGKRAV